MSGGRRATYRLQLGPDLDLDGAAALVPYLEALGISCLYLSPVTEAVPGSAHGYDVVDPTRVRAELGGEDALARCATAAHDAGLRVLVDIVPNHMATAGRANPWWWSLLAEGREGPAGSFFDVDWGSSEVGPPETVLVPVLGRPLADVVAAGELRVDRSGPEPVLRYHDQELPLAAGSLDDAPALTTLLERQHYRLVDWRRAPEVVDYRRFFDISSLIGVRVEDPAVFDVTHVAYARWIRAGLVDGLRVDHVDGLRDPTGYLRRLRDLAGDEVWIVVEKILAEGESLPTAWPVAGTTGYELAFLADGVLVDPDGGAPLTRAWEKWTDDPRAWPDVVREAKEQAVDDLFVADVERAARAFGVALDAEADALVPVLREVVVAFDVYRTYVGPGEVAGAQDAAHVTGAVEVARVRHPRDPLVDEVESVLLGVRDDAAAEAARLRFQQVTGPVTAKGVEDTAMYRYLRLVARNEVGGDPGRFAVSVDEVHRAFRRMHERRPEGLLAVATHDTKRSGDLRARLAVLSEVPDAWQAAVGRWHDAAAPHRAGDLPDRATEYLVWQTLVGAWPIGVERLQAYVRKAIREAKRATSWLAPDAAYEAAVAWFLDGVTGDASLMGDVASFVVGTLLVPGRVDALAQTLLQCTAPGVPDLYRGAELWDLALVDPDNRRPVDFELRRFLVAESRAASVPPVAALAQPDDPGRPKLWTILRALDLRRRRPELFGPGEAGRYEPLDVRGAAAGHVVAFVRGGAAVTVVPRLTVRLAGDFGETALDLPAGTWRDVLSGTVHGGGATALRTILAGFPVALLERLDP